MAGLVANGYRGPWRWNNLDWELSFYRAWRAWPPQLRNPEMFPRFELGGHRTGSEGRELLWQLKATSPFHAYQNEQLPLEPLGLPPAEYLDIWVEGASPEEWVALAATFLEEMSVPSTDAADT